MFQLLFEGTGNQLASNIDEVNSLRNTVAKVNSAISLLFDSINLKKISAGEMKTLKIPFEVLSPDVLLSFYWSAFLDSSVDNFLNSLRAKKEMILDSSSPLIK
jgi:hypothetical protein